MVASIVYLLLKEVLTASKLHKCMSAKADSKQTFMTYYSLV